MQEKLFAIGDDFWIENEAGERTFKVNGKAFRIRDTLILQSPGGDELYSIQEKKLRVRDTMDIERDGHQVATVKKALVTPLRDRFSIEVHDGDDMEAKGNIVDHEYKIERRGMRSQRSHVGGSGYATPTVSRSNRAKMMRSCLRWSSASTRCLTTSASGSSTLGLPGLVEPSIVVGAGDA
jgi:uncharacterized protein YxjI